MRSKIALAIIITPALAACAATPKPTIGSSTSQQRPIVSRPVPPPATNPQPAPSGFRAARVMDVPGLEGVIGASASALTRQFGTPRLNVTEGDVRKLQFSGQPCVLDVYLYPPRPGAEPLATYVDTRRASDGIDVDRAACVAALRRQ